MGGSIWKPIATVPQDGTHVLISDLSSNVGFGMCGNPPCQQPWAEVAHWFEDGLYSSCYGADQQEPHTRATHWRHLIGEEECPGHVASAHDKRVCGRCGIHIDSLRPDEASPQ